MERDELLRVGTLKDRLMQTTSSTSMLSSRVKPFSVVGLAIVDIDLRTVRTGCLALFEIPL